MRIFHVLKGAGEKLACLICLSKHEALSNKVESFHCSNFPSISSFMKLRFNIYGTYNFNICQP